MLPRNPYLLRAIYDWVLDNNLTPHLLVDADVPDVQVPFEYVEEGQIVLNVHPQAVHGMDMGNDAVSFSARFGSQSLNIYVPVNAVRAVFARENGEGVLLPLHDAEVEEAANDDASQEQASERPSQAKHPHLRVVK